MQPTTSCPRCAADLDPDAAFCSTCGLARTPVPSSGGTPRPLLGDSVLDLLRHITIGEYDIGGQLGAGGMASVYLAHELRLNRRVAIKAMLPELLRKADMVERFFDEARKQARLEHRNIVPIYSLQWNTDLPFFVMKFVDGFSTDDIVRARGALPIPVVQHILTGVIAALQYAHDEGVIHRDVKPGNILIDRGGEPIVSDFGIAKAAESPHLTQTGAAIGTPAYMSPEQCRAQPLTAASDQYSVGILAYQLLTGSTPFSGSMLEMLVAHTGKAPAPLVEGRPDCPPRLALAVMRMLEKSADDRWPRLRDALPDVRDGMGDEESARQQLVELFPDRKTPAETLPLVPQSPLPPASRAPHRAIPVITLVATPADGRWEVEVGDTVRIVARRVGDPNVDQPPPTAFAWASTDNTVATVTADGAVTAHAPGRVTIVAVERGRTARCELTMSAPKVATIRIHPPTGLLVVGEMIAFVAEALDARGRTLTDRTFDWRCNDSSRAATSDDGIVLALAPGEVQVTASSEGVECAVPLTIAPIPVATVTIPAPREAIAEGEPARHSAAAVTAVREGNGASGQPRVVRAVIGGGILVAVAAIVFVATRTRETPVSPTTTVVTRPDSVRTPEPAVVPPDSVRAPGATKADTPRKTEPPVTAPLPPTTVARVALNLTKRTATVGDTLRATARAFDADGMRMPRAKIELGVSAPKVLSVDPTGLVIARAPGNSTVTAQSGTASAALSVTVTALPVAVTTQQSNPPPGGLRAEPRAAYPIDVPAPPTTARAKPPTAADATLAIATVLSSVSAGRWGDVQNILQRDVLDSFKDRVKLRVFMSGEPRIVDSAGDGATVDFDAGMTWTNLAGRPRNGQAALRAKLARSGGVWRVAEMTARATLP